MFSKILVANRGEIACRVLRTARTLGYATVAVYSDADAQALHVQQADEAVHLGPAPAADSYLNIAALLAAAHASGADAVHPGYGFLSERADFAQACADAGLVFIGPPPAAILAMGDKAQAKRRMAAAGVACVPGWMPDADNEDSDTRLQAEAAALGFPLLVKAVAGGGGRGMRRVKAAHELAEALAGARREALSAFGDGRLMLERLVERGRHVEVQVFADTHGHCIHLGERDCTAQRRRQKLLEEAPSPIVTPALRAALCRDAVAAAQAAAYVGAGTVEFIVDPAGQHFFLEMNTRLQVEHPVTEMLTGLDLVEWQLRVAAGEALPLTQEQVRWQGHAIEARLVTEDPALHFSPQTGRVLHWQPQAALHAQPGLRIDHGLAEGDEIGPHYDGLVAKLVVHGHNRTDALRRLAAALARTPLVGPQHNGHFLQALLQHPRFVQAKLHTSLLDEWDAVDGTAEAQPREACLQRPRPDDTLWALAALLLQSGPHGHGSAAPPGLAGFGLRLQCQGEERCLMPAHTAAVQLVSWRGREVRYAAAGVQHRVLVVVQKPSDGQHPGDTLHIAQGAAVFSFSEPSPYPRADTALDAARARAPVAGVVAQLRVAVGDAVAAGQPLLCVEAMKMEMWLHATAAGTVKAVHVNLKDSVAQGAVLVELELEISP